MTKKTVFEKILTKDECVGLIRIHNAFISEKEQIYTDTNEISNIIELIRKNYIKSDCFEFETAGTLVQQKDRDPITDTGLAAMEKSWVKYCSEISRYMKIACCFDKDSPESGESLVLENF